jgi:phage tail sheath protein FI
VAREECANRRRQAPNVHGRADRDNHGRHLRALWTVARGVHEGARAPLLLHFLKEVIPHTITKIAMDVTKREQDLLNPKGINALRFFPGRASRRVGRATISPDASWKYINVRRLFLLSRSRSTKERRWVVFETERRALWARVRQSITNFLTTVWRSGRCSATRRSGFFVRCDYTTWTRTTSTTDG